MPYCRLGMRTSTREKQIFWDKFGFMGSTIDTTKVLHAHCQRPLCRQHHFVLQELAHELFVYQSYVMNLVEGRMKKRFTPGDLKGSAIITCTSVS